MSKIFTTPFAKTGNKVAVPDAIDTDGDVSYTEGFNYNFERNLATDPLAKPVGRQKLNQIFNDITDAVGDVQTALITVATTGAYVAGGTPFVATPAKALSTLTGARLHLSFSAAGGAAPTINVSGLGAKSIKQYDSTGAKVAPVITANQLVDVEYDGIDFVLLDQLPYSAGQQKFTANGSFNVPTNVRKLFVTLVGGGGGGAGAISTSPYSPGGGGAGGVKYRVPLSVSPGQVISVTIGAGGAGGFGTASGGTFANSNGGGGGTSSFGALLSASGGGGGFCQSTSASGGAAGTTEYAGAGASGSPVTGVSGGAGGGNIFSAAALAGHDSPTGVLYGGGGAGGRSTGYWFNGAAGAAGLCIVEW